MKSLLYQGGLSVPVPSVCTALPCRTEQTFTLRKHGRLYRFTVRDKIVPEDPYFVLVKAAAYARKTNTAYVGASPKRNVRDFLIKDSVVI
jgi:hypothetical protein